MPIKLNLLAEAQAAEELRRKDPIKRAILAGALVVAAMFIWSAVLYAEIYVARSEQQRLETTWKSNEKRYNELVAQQKLLGEMNSRIAAMDRYHTNRFLWGTTLNAFQQSIPPSLVDKIQVLRLNGLHDYQVTEAIPPKKRGKVTEPGVPASARERITITIDGRDYGHSAEQNYNRFKNALVSVPFFKEVLTGDTVLLKSVSQPLRDNVEQREYFQFTLECRFPTVTRHE
ncbi:MAG: hypothetical protein ACK4UN_06525 [Limisphaerales bacterium]